MSFFLFTSKFIRFWILNSNWVRLNLSISCFIMVCIHGKVIVIVASQMFSLLLQLTFMTISFNIEWFKNFLSFSQILFTIFGALLTLYNLTSVCIFSILFSINFFTCWQGEFFWQSRGSSVYYHCLYSHNLNVWFRGVIEKGS